MFSVPVCNIFKETMVEGHLCYQADLDRFRDEVEREKIVSEGFVFLLDYNEDRMVTVGAEEEDMEEGNADAKIFVETVGEN